jgi:protein-disulfide isomerase
MSFRTATLVALGLFFLLGCEPREVGDPAAAASATPSGSGGSDASDSTVVARIGAETITAEDLDDWIKDDLFDRETSGGNGAKTFEVRNEALTRMIRTRVVQNEATRRNTTEDALLLSEMAAMGTVTDEEINEFYQERVDQMGGLSLEQVSGRIGEYLQQQRGLEFVEKLLAEADVEILLEQPRVSVAADGPSKGPDDAAVTIIEFSDFQCPFCSRALPVLAEVLERYPEDVRLVYRHLPLDSIHPRARTAAEASLCAEAQRQFWEYHDALFENNNALADEDLRAIAETLGLDVPAWAQCMSENVFAVRVEADLEAGRSVGISGTPAFLINGLLLTGARPVEDFVKMIDSELARIGKQDAS